jgi:KDO2-lipid IV(A) lauroyltransferase
MSKATPKGLYAPQSWPSWFGFAIVWLLIQSLPHRWLLALSHFLAYPVKQLAIRRRKIAKLNLQTCFPDMPSNQLNQLVHDHFASAIMGILEMGMGWWLPDRRLKHMVTVEGKEYLDKALSEGKGVLLISPHFTCLEIIGRLFKQEINLPWSGMYRPHENPVIEYFFRRYRSQYFSNLVARDDIRTFVKELRKNQIVWFATDQNYRSKGKVMAPFFGVPASTHTGASRITKMSGANMVPMGYYRRKDKSGYVIKFYPPPQGYPTDDEVENAVCINQLFETMILDATEQYFWLHRKFKVRDQGLVDIYEQHGI